MVGRHKYQMIQTQKPQGQEQQQQQRETTRNNTKLHETTIQRDSNNDCGKRMRTNDGRRQRRR